MEKKECIEDNKNNQLEMSDEKCNDCSYLYECRFMIAEITEITYGGW